MHLKWYNSNLYTLQNNILHALVWYRTIGQVIRHKITQFLSLCYLIPVLFRVRLTIICKKLNFIPFYDSGNQVLLFISLYQKGRATDSKYTSPMSLIGRKKNTSTSELNPTHDFKIFNWMLQFDYSKWNRLLLTGQKRAARNIYINIVRSFLFVTIAKTRQQKKKVACFLLGNSPGSEFYMPTFRNTVRYIVIGG